MARIVLTTMGTSGDLNPFLGLACGLRARGHEIIFAVEDNFRVRVEEEGFAVHHLTGNLEDAISPYLNQVIGRLSPLPSFKILFEKWILPTLRSKVEELCTVCANADLLIARAEHLAASIAAEITGTPWIHMTMTALNLPSKHFNPSLLPTSIPERLSPYINQLTWALVETILRNMADASINKVRTDYGLAPQCNLLGTGNHSHLLTAVAVSPTFMPSPPDWPSYICMTGFCFWDTPITWQEPAELTAFLDDSSPVIAVSFGSMAPSVKKEFTRFYRTSVAAIRHIGAKALVIGAADGVLSYPLPDDVYSLPFAPFSLVYPRCAGVIHHGGNYTAGEALRAGIPALVVPWGFDLFFSAAQVQRIGAGRWLHPRFYTVRAAEQRLKAILDKPCYKQSTQAIAAQISQEDGVKTLCDAIEAVL